ncbi:uncharacterized protein LOC118447467 isoform X1 [Vespa mandarinia]|uniref:uncharacterized protein LOC118447467 isoform X1 n=1 Tax=Vespa mandarinia TaxID=7446 RepID=UPI001610E54B|nr:uncharacterized protein LOC118447467 isoform X1 [Vespa mandarinia]
MSMLEEGRVDEESISRLSTQEYDPVPPQLKKVNELLKSISTQLEDCALECQAKVSHQQWKIFSSKTVIHEPWEESVLARTFFSEKVLDETFQNLLSCNKSFLEQLNDFIVLLQNKQPNLSISEKQDVPMYCPDITASQISMCKPIAETLDLSLLNYANSNVLRKEGNHFHTHFLGINNSFADVIKAKINFDTKFLGFEAVLHKTSTTSPSDVSCLCKICSNDSVRQKRKIEKLTLDKKQKKMNDRIIRQTKTSKWKRSTRSKKSFIRRQGKKQSASLGDGDRSNAICKRKK